MGTKQRMDKQADTNSRPLLAPVHNKKNVGKTGKQQVGTQTLVSEREQIILLLTPTLFVERREEDLQSLPGMRTAVDACM